MDPLDTCDAALMQETLDTELQERFGFSELRGKQKEVIHRLMIENGSADANVCRFSIGNCAQILSDSGGGKSLCYQLPSLCFDDGLTLVISPLIALMKDQCDALAKKGIKAARLDSSNSADEDRQAKMGVQDGSLKLLYVAPERLNNESFIKSMQGIKIALLAVDEAHCVSSWGHSFRPDYLKISRFARDFNVERVLCLTATATKKVADDICEEFGIDPAKGLFMSSVFRDNLSLITVPTSNDKEKLEHLVNHLKHRTGPCIVYVTVQKQAEEVCAKLKAAGIAEAQFYHAGLTNDVRKSVQDNFMASESGVVCCTIAFGMGIDKANIRSIVHYSLSKTLENYSQECGRAGRDSQASECFAYLCGDDIPILQTFCRGDTPSQANIESWLRSLSKLPEETLEGVNYILANRYQQMRDFDTKEVVLGLLYARLELEWGFVRATTPMYAVYDITPVNPQGMKSVENDQDPAAVIIRKLWKSGLTKGVRKYAIDCLDAARASKLPRDVISRKINQWERNNFIQSKGSQVRHRFVVNKALPKTTAEVKEVAQDLFDYMVKKETDDIERLEKLCETMTTEKCMHQGLCDYFGDENGPGQCGNRCTFCKTGKASTFAGAGIKGQPLDKAKAAKVLGKISVKDPRTLTNFAFGITTPLLSYTLKLTKDKEFGLMSQCNYVEVFNHFQSICDKAKKRSNGAIQGEPSAKKVKL